MANAGNFLIVAVTVFILLLLILLAGCAAPREGQNSAYWGQLTKGVGQVENKP